MSFENWQRFVDKAAERRKPRKEKQKRSGQQAKGTRRRNNEMPVLRR